MRQSFNASIWQEGEWLVAQCLEVDVASQGKTEGDALSDLREALELYFERPTATMEPQIHIIEVEIGAAIATVLPSQIRPISDEDIIHTRRR